MHAKLRQALTGGDTIMGILPDGRILINGSGFTKHGIALGMEIAKTLNRGSKKSEYGTSTRRLSVLQRRAYFQILQDDSCLKYPPLHLKP